MEDMSFRDKKETLLERDRVRYYIELLKDGKVEEALKLLEQYEKSLTEAIETGD